MEQENRAGCILHGCGVLAALAGLCAASGAACVFALTPGWRVWALPVFFLLALAGAACGLLLYAACRYFVISEEPSKINFAETLAAIQAKYPR